MIIVETGQGIEGSNSYANRETIDDYLATSLETAEWDAASPELKDKIIITAARILESQFKWDGRQTKFDQSMEWPREKVRALIRFEDQKIIPKRLIYAQAELANELSKTPSFQSRPEAAGGADQIKAISLGKGALELDFQNQSETGANSNEGKTVVTPYIRELLEGLGSFKHNASGMVRISRS